MGTIHKAIAVSLLAMLATGSGLMAEESATLTAKSAPLSLEQVINNLVRRNQERAQALVRAEATRVYHLTYHGFPGDHEAEMTVEAKFQSPTTKDFKIISQSGSKLIIDHVFKKLLESEQEAAQPEMSARMQLNRENYDFQLLGYEPSESGGQYVLQVSPKAKSKYVYRGKIWVDATDFAVVRIEAEPAQNPSFWTKKSEIHHEYEKVQDFWLPARNQSVSSIRLGGIATLTIEYKDYQVTRVSSGAEPISVTSSARTTE
jgi:hypothetical protein